MFIVKLNHLKPTQYWRCGPGACGSHTENYNILKIKARMKVIFSWFLAYIVLVCVLKQFCDVPKFNISLAIRAGARGRGWVW